MVLHPDVLALAQQLRRIETLLRNHDGRFWADQVASCAAEIERADAHGLHRFLSLLGGMGSLNDVVLHRDGGALGPENDRLRGELDDAYELATRLAREG